MTCEHVLAQKKSQACICVCVLISVKILVVEGNPTRRNLEIIGFINKKSNIAANEYQGHFSRWKGLDEYGSRVGVTDAILQTQPLICIIGIPNHSFDMMMPARIKMSSVVLNESKIWVTGGLFNNGSVKSTEIISLDQPPVPGPDLPFTVCHHSMVLADPTTIYLIGGYQNHQSSNKTWIIDPTNDFQMKVGPSLNITRNGHSCSKMRIQGNIFLVVAGGRNRNFIPLDSVELLDTTCPDQGWKMGMK